MRVKWSMLLQPLSQSLMANLAIARSEAPTLLRAHLDSIAGWEGDGWEGRGGAVPPLLDAPAAAVMCLIARWVGRCFTNPPWQFFDSQVGGRLCM